MHAVNNTNTPRQVMPDQAFAALGGGRVAYVKPMTSDAILAAFPNVADLDPGQDLWALLGADGMPIMVSDDPKTLVANAWANDLETVYLH